MTDETGQLELRSILTSTKVGELIVTSCLTLDPTDTVAAAAAEMRNTSHGSVLVCAEGKLVGIFTERDMLQAIHGGRTETALADVMSPHPQTVTTDSSLFDAIRLMDEGGYRRLPVVDPTGSPVGILDVKSVVHFLVEHFPAAVYNQASHAQLIARHREGA